MQLNEVINLITQNGMSIVIIGYFLYKDYKFNEQILSVLGEVKEVLASLQTWHEKEANRE